MILDQLRARANPQKAAEMAAYHKAERVYLGVSNPDIDAIVRGYQQGGPPLLHLAEAASLWDSDIHEARVAAAKLLTKARIREGEAEVWAEIARWVLQFDAWAVADHACAAGSRRLSAVPDRLDQVETLTGDSSKWVRRAALVMTLPWAKLTHPNEAELAARERILGWAASYTTDKDWFIQKSVSWWLRTLSKKDPERVTRFVDAHGASMKAFARKDALRAISG